MPKLSDANQSRRSRLAIVAGYAVIGIGWILVSDTVVNALPGGIRDAVSTTKGVAYVLVTGALLWIALVARDVLLARGREALTASEERYRLLAEHQRDIVYRFRVTPVPGFEYVSPSIASITGHTPEEHYANPELGHHLINPEDLAVLAGAATGDAGPVVIRWQGKDGETVFTEHHVTPIRDARGGLVAVEGVARDVTARIEAEALGRQLTTVIETTPVGVALLGRRADGSRITFANAALARLAGRDGAELIGRDPADLLELAGQAQLAAAHTRIEAGEATAFEATVPTPDGRRVAVEILASPVASPDGNLESVAAIVLDRTEATARRQAETQLGLVLDASPAPIVVTDPDNIVTQWNPAAERVFGWCADEVLGQRFPLLPEASHDDYRALRMRLGGGPEPAAGQMMLRHRDGHEIPCRVQVALVPGDSSTRPGMVGVIEDLSAEIEQQRAQARLASAIDAAGEAILITDLEGTITYVNPAFERVSGYARGELIGQNPRILQSGLTSVSVYTDLWSRLRSGQVWRGVLFNRRKDGTLFEEEATLSPVFDPAGEPIAYVGVKRDLTLERTLSEGLASELNDRAAVQETMARLEMGETPEETAQLLCEALAGFPDVDDAILQHLTPADGPAVLIGLAGDAARSRRVGDRLDPEAAAAIRTRAAGGAWSSQQPGAPELPPVHSEDTSGLTTVAAPVRHRGRPVGVLYLGARTDSPDAWVARYLRIASELAAHVGPMLGPQLSMRAGASTSAEEVLRIIDEGAFAAHFQPICDLRSGDPVGWESLTRFDDGVPPSRRFADAHLIGLGMDLEYACGRRAVDVFSALGRTGWLSVNVSPSLVLSGRAAGIVRAARGPIVLELTEAVPVADHGQLRDALEALKAPTMIAVDDAGGGYSGLRDVLGLRPDFVKLDIGLVHEIDRDTARQALVTGMVQHASETGARLIAEGVETEAERRTLVRLGVPLGQGLLLGPPSPVGAAGVATPG